MKNYSYLYICIDNNINGLTFINKLEEIKIPYHILEELKDYVYVKIFIYDIFFYPKSFIDEFFNILTRLTIKVVVKSCNSATVKEFDYDYFSYYRSLSIPNNIFINRYGIALIYEEFLLNISKYDRKSISSNYYNLFEFDNKKFYTISSLCSEYFEDKEIPMTHHLTYMNINYYLCNGFFKENKKIEDILYNKYLNYIENRHENYKF